MRSVPEMEARNKARQMFREEGAYTNPYDIIKDAFQYRCFMNEVKVINKDQRQSL